MLNSSGRTVKLVASVLVLSGALGQSASADQFHNNNLIIGTRAVGLGGAFGAVADDASGVYYNPAGLAFALSNDISGSANAYYKKETTYKKTLGNDAFVEESGGSVPSFFGGLQKLDRFVSGLVFAFGVYSTDNDLKDQDTSIENKTINSTVIERYHRTSNARANTFYGGAAVGMRLTPNIAIGGGASYFNADELVQEYQDAKQTTQVKLSNGENSTGWRILTSNVREHLVIYGVQPVLGVQAALPGNLALGLTLKKGFVASQNLQLSTETRTQTLDQAGRDQLADANLKSATAVVSEAISPSAGKTPNVENPVGDWPAEARLAMAWFASPNFMLAFDVLHHTAVTNAAKTPELGNKARFNKEAVTDFALGLEYYASPSFPIRMGLFTNNDARPEVKKGTPNRDANLTCGLSTEFRDKYCGQPDHIDYRGASLFIGWVQPNSQLSAGLVLQQGEGKAQKLGDHQVQEVEASSNIFAFSITHNL